MDAPNPPETPAGQTPQPGGVERRPFTAMTAMGPIPVLFSESELQRFNDHQRKHIPHTLDNGAIIYANAVFGIVPGHPGKVVTPQGGSIIA